MVANSSQKPVAESIFQNAGVDMALVEWVNENTNSVWIRDYGPRFICDPNSQNNDGRASVDTAYYSNRPADDNLPVELGKTDQEPIGFGHNNFNLNVIMHSGGNGHYFSNNKVFASRLLVNDNSNLNEEALKDYWLNYHGAELHLFEQLSFNVDGTGHIDMWLLPVSNNAVIIGEWSKDDRFASKAKTDSAAQYMLSQGYTVYRTPNWNGAPKKYGYATHYTYTNAVIANHVVVISKFNKEPEDSEAKAVFEAAFPGRTIVQVDSSGIITRSGALHCIAQHVYDCSPPDSTTTTQATSTTTTTTEGTTTATETTTTAATETTTATITTTFIAPDCKESGRSCAGGKSCCSGACPDSNPQKCP